MTPSDFPVSRAQCDWFYRRSGGTVMHSPHMLNSGWFEPERRGHYAAPNLVAEAARDFGFHGDEIRLALAQAGVREGQKIGDLVRPQSPSRRRREKSTLGNSAPAPGPPP